MSSWSKVWDVECVTSPAVLPNAVCNRSECGLLPSLWRCVSFCPISYHKSTGGRISSSTSSRRRSSGRSRRVAAASRRSGRSARRAGPREARFVHVDLARQSSAMVFAWYIRPHSAADGGAGGELRAGASLVTVDVLTGHICSDGARQVRLACAEPQTSSGPGPGGRAHEAV